jgi:zinc and cadmium transporter
MIMTWAYALGSVIAVSLVSFVGLTIISLNLQAIKRAILLLVALSTGALFGDAIIHLLPEIFESAPSTTAASLWILGGILIFFGLEKFLRWGHSHEINPCDEPGHHEIKPVGKMNLISDALHNFIDGLAIGASFLVNPTVGFATTIAVILHEIPQEMGDFGILLHAGYSKWRALSFNLLSALAAVLGTIMVLLLGESGSLGITAILLPITAGGFIYIAGSDLVPELHKTKSAKQSLAQFGALIVGLAAMYFLTYLE